LIKQINKNNEIKFLILTNLPNEFTEFNNVTIIHYDKNVFSYNDKIILFKEGFKIGDAILLLDADTSLRENYNFNDINLQNIAPGIYPQLTWKHPCSCSMENFLLGNTERVPYGLSYKKYCEDNGLNVKNATLIQESFILIKKDNNINNFIETWEKLADFCNKKDIERNQSILGYGEGYNIGVAALNSNLNIIEHNINIIKLIKCFKHYAWEKWDIE
jgi:hypothetical protein